MVVLSLQLAAFKPCLLTISAIIILSLGLL